MKLKIYDSRTLQITFFALCIFLNCIFCNDADAEPAKFFDLEFRLNFADIFQISTPEKKYWFQTGFWPLFLPALSAATSSLFAIYLIFVQSSRNFKILIRQKKIDRLSSCLNDFYNPLLALIEINGEIFAKLGPRSFPIDHVSREATALLWNEAKKKIIENNAAIEALLKTKSHLMTEFDDIEFYEPLLMHVAMYNIFQTIQSDRQKEFLFPHEIHAHISRNRTETLAHLKSLLGEKT